MAMVLSHKLVSSVRRNHIWNIGQTRFRTRFAYPQGMKAYEDDYVDVPQYPTVDYETRHYPIGVKARRKEVLDWQESIRNKDTVEEKLIEMNVNRCVYLSSSLASFFCFALLSLWSLANNIGSSAHSHSNLTIQYYLWNRLFFEVTCMSVHVWLFKRMHKENKWIHWVDFAPIT